VKLVVDVLTFLYLLYATCITDFAFRLWFRRIVVQVPDRENELRGRRPIRIGIPADHPEAGVGDEGAARELVLSAWLLGGFGGQVRAQHGKEPPGIWRRQVAIRHTLCGLQTMLEERRRLPREYMFQADGAGVHVRRQPDSGRARIQTQEAGFPEGGPSEGRFIASVEAPREELGQITST
jgi:hypothetical protein